MRGGEIDYNLLMLLWIFVLWSKRYSEISGIIVISHRRKKAHCQRLSQTQGLSQRSPSFLWWYRIIVWWSPVALIKGLVHVMFLFNSSWRENRLKRLCCKVSTSCWPLVWSLHVWPLEQDHLWWLQHRWSNNHLRSSDLALPCPPLFNSIFFFWPFGLRIF